MIVLSRAQLKIIADAAERAYPAECCGLLVGRAEKVRGEGGGAACDAIVVTRVAESRNIALDEFPARTVRDRFEVDPELRLALMRELEGPGALMGGGAANNTQVGGSAENTQVGGSAVENTQVGGGAQNTPVGGNAAENTQIGGEAAKNTQIGGEAAAGKTGEKIVGFYHSHPDHPAQPSARDLACAFEPELVWVIMSVEKGKAGQATAHRLDPGLDPPGRRFREIPLRTED